MVETIDHSAIFDAAATPFAKGVTLVEASAGTGKTFAISMLVLRAVVELGVDLKEILVVTYTVAATEELRERIRSRLIQARNYLRAPEGRADEVLSNWLKGIADCQEAARRLELALLDIDAMGIYTIHGFCQRILSEQVLESGHFFDADLLSDTMQQRNELIRDFWRSRLYGIDKSHGSLILSRYANPGELYKSIKGADNPLWYLMPEDLTFEEACQGLVYSREQLHSWWLLNRQKLGQDLEEADRKGFLKAGPSRDYPAWLDSIDRSLSAGSSPAPGIVAELIHDRLIDSINGTRVRGVTKKKALVDGWTLPGGEAHHYLDAVERLFLAVRLELARYLRRELPRRLEDRGLLSFDQLIIALARTIESTTGATLIRQVGIRYKVALIDEFQDTDTAQYRIFSKLFGQAAHYLYLIGDPKQAIYRFRGADIHSYLEARKKVNRRLTLDCNYRSNPGLVTAVNHLLEASNIGGSLYQPVRSPRNRSFEKLVKSGIEEPGLIFCQLDKKSHEDPGWAAVASEERIRSWIVNEVQLLIGRGSALAVERVDGRGSLVRTAVRPGDIGILVRTNKQAEQFFNEFSRCGIPAVLSSRKGVFQTREGQDLLQILQAVAAPSDDALLRTVLGRDWFGLNGKQFYQLCLDEERFNRRRDRFHEYRRCWNESGALLMMNQLLENEQVFLNLSRSPQAERRVTNIQHLVELVQQQQSERRLSIAQTLTWLQEKLLDPAAQQQAELRLESDGDAVNVITMHSAKGLEYEIVFCPFLYRSTVAANRSESIDCYDPQKGRICDLGSDLFEYHSQLSQDEETEEEMRLAYVAVTRARLRTYLFWADIKPGSKTVSAFFSPLGRLLFPDGSCSPEQQLELLQKLGSAEHCQYRLISAAQPKVIFEPELIEEQELQARRFSDQRLQTNRIRTSFSGLTMLSKHHGEESFRAGDERGGLVRSEEDALPGGVRFGNLVHDALEIFSFADLALRAVEPEKIEQLLSKYRFDIDPQVVLRLLQDTVTTTLGPDSREKDNFSLAAIPSDRQIKEMEFNLHLDLLSTRRINDILASEKTVTNLRSRDMEGYLSGFVDLVFEYGGRYYVVDYKTNNLGSEGYARKGLLRAMQAHNYGLQYWIYTLVVHRFLQNWVAGYRYQDHFGGVMYLFVRGMQPDKPGSGVFFDRPGETQLMRLDESFGAGGHG